MGREATFKDHFSERADVFALARPRYPEEWFSFLASQSPGNGLAWDCGTGNGQAALSLTNYFDRVIATDASAEQIRHAVAHEKVRYVVARAEESGLETGSADLITAAASIHWFDLEKFYPEARRILKPGGILAAWSYGFAKITDEVDEVIRKLSAEILRDYWPKENKLVWDGYRDLPFPFVEIAVPRFKYQATWDLTRLVAYLNTWSSTQRYVAAKQSNPLDLVFGDLQRAWGDRDDKKLIDWNVAIRVGRN